LVAAMLLCGAGNFACGRLSRRPSGVCLQLWWLGPRPHGAGL